MSEADKSRGIVLILAPIGRDATAIAGLIDRAGLCPVICKNPQDLIENLDRVIEVVVVAEEAIYGSNNLHVLEGWVARQPPWSDQPFIVVREQRLGR